MNTKLLNIGYVDDDVVFQVLIKRLTKHFNLVKNIIQFYNAKDALNFLNKNIDNHDKLPDLLFVDLNMPVMDGWDLVDELINIENNKPLPIKIYICSSSESLKDKEKFKKYSRLEQYVVKPLTKNTMEKLLHDVTLH
ncbi:response regulator [Candidatus Kapabacteria bacterium]|nr:response regulator [Candidatus Kapabacteria bacterium]